MNVAPASLRSFSANSSRPAVTAREAEKWLRQQTFNGLDKHIVSPRDRSLPQWVRAKVTGEDAKEAGIQAHRLEINHHRVWGISNDEGNVVGIDLYDVNGRKLAAGWAAGPHYSSDKIKLMGVAE